MKRKPVRPVLRWPWCDVCRAHVREIDDAAHICVALQEFQLQLSFEWRVS